MNMDQVIRTLINDNSEEHQIKAVDLLQPHLNDELVLSALCCACLKTISPRLREHIIASLMPMAEAANLLFKRAAMLSPNALTRQWAFLNLSLMECRTAMNIVMDGLNDRNRQVQKSAALNIGLYQDQQFIASVERYFEINSFGMIAEGVCHLANHIYGKFNARRSTNCSKAPAGNESAPEYGDVYGVDTLWEKAHI